MQYRGSCHCGNIRCIEGLEYDKVPVKHVDGRSF